MIYASGNVTLIGCNIFPTTYWHKVGELVMPCGSPVHWYLFKGSYWFKLGTENVNLSLSLGCIDIV
jgi:hypothetical protein